MTYEQHSVVVQAVRLSSCLYRVVSEYRHEYSVANRMVRRPRISSR